MRAIVHSAALPIEYVIDSTNDSWIENMAAVADWIASRFACGSDMCFLEADSMHCDVVVWEGTETNGSRPETVFSVLRGSIAASIGTHCRQHCYLDSDEWVCCASPNYQILVFSNVMRDETIAFIN